MYFAHLACQTFDDKFEKKYGTLPKTRNAIFGNGFPTNQDSSGKLSSADLEIPRQEEKSGNKAISKKNITSLAEMLGFKHLQQK
jgi:hypothetical protein